ERRKQLVNDPAGLLREAVEVCKGVSAGLGAAHSHGIVHRDVKPGNIIMVSGDQGCRPVLIDFGIAYVEDEERITQWDEAVGNARYSASPMAYKTDEVPPWYDVFELAQVLMWMLEHERPPKHYWQRPLDWRFVKYDPRLPVAIRLALQSVTALCSQHETPPDNGDRFLQLLHNRLEAPPSTAEPSGLDEFRINEILVEAAARADLRRVTDIAVIAASAPLALQAIEPV